MPRVVQSHHFSAAETLSNFDIYVLDNTKASGWATMADLGQTEFTPLYGYFINNKTGVEQTLTVNYKQFTQNDNPGNRLFVRNLTPGWNVIGVADPADALPQKDSNSVDTNNIQPILGSFANNIDSILDFTADQSDRSSVKIGDNWGYAVNGNFSSLNDFRETKAYGVYVTNAGTYHGYQNNDPILIYDPVSLNLKPVTETVNGSASGVSLLDFFVNTGYPINFYLNNVDVKLLSEGIDGSNISNLRLSCNNNNVAVVSAPLLGDNYITASSSLPAGTSECQVLIDINNVNQTGYIQVSINGLDNQANWGVLGNKIGNQNIPGEIDGYSIYFAPAYVVNQAVISANSTATLTGSPNDIYNIGDEDAALASFNITDAAGVGSSLNRYLVLKSVTLKNNGNAELANVISNLALEESGVKVSAFATVNGKYVTFILANGGLTIDKGDDITLKVTGDIITEDSSNNQIQFMLNNSSDMDIMDIEESGNDYAATVSTNVNDASFNSANATFDYTILNAGNVTISKDATSPTQKSYVKNTKDVVALLVNVKANQAFSADGMKLDIHASSTGIDFSNVRLYVNNVLVDSKDPDNTATSIGYLNYDSSVSINQGNNVIKVLLDVNSDAHDGSYITLELNHANAFTNPVYANDNVVERYRRNCYGRKVTVSTASLTATRNDGFADLDKIVAGTPTPPWAPSLCRPIMTTSPSTRSL